MSISFLTRLAGASALALLGAGGLSSPALSQPIPHSAYDDPAWQSAFSAAPHRAEGRLWTARGQLTPAADKLLAILSRADLDGMASHQMVARDVERAIAAAASGNEADLERAEDVLSSAWVHYVQTLRRPAEVGMLFVDRSLQPTPPSPERILAAAAAAPSLERHLEEVSRVNPVYAQLREGLAALTASGSADPALVRDLRLNLDRARILPASGRYILVDAASQRLLMVEDGDISDSMKVIVGKPDQQTPMLASRVEYAMLNPYWNVPPDLVRERIAPNVLKQGAAYLREKNYELLSGWEQDARELDVSEVDWGAVAAGRQEVRVRQRPGPGNMMGDIKFMFPNELGVYLHDTPDKDLFAKSQRTLSSGCVRLEDPMRLARWLFGETPRPRTGQPDEAIRVPRPVPVFITYLTAAWDGNQVARRPDVYGRDRTARTAAAGIAASD